MLSVANSSVSVENPFCKAWRLDEDSSKRSMDANFISQIIVSKGPEMNYYKVKQNRAFDLVSVKQRWYRCIGGGI
jgi:hypothetical protein